MRTVVADLCGTLIRENTTRGFLNYIPLNGVRSQIRHLGLSKLAQKSSVLLRRDLARQLMVRSLAGASRDLLYRVAREYVREKLLNNTRADVLSSVMRAKAEGATVYLATASLDPIASGVIDELSLDGGISSRLQYDDGGHCTGALESDVTGNKWAALCKRFPGIEHSEVCVYTDNEEDVDLKVHASTFHFIDD